MDLGRGRSQMRHHTCMFGPNEQQPAVALLVSLSCLRFVPPLAYAISCICRRPKLISAGEPGMPKIVGFQLDEILALSSMRIKLNSDPEDKDFRQPQKLTRALRVRFMQFSSLVAHGNLQMSPTLPPDLAYSKACGLPCLSTVVLLSTCSCRPVHTVPSKVRVRSGRRKHGIDVAAQDHLCAPVRLLHVVLCISFAYPL